ncbi:hypothetical protein KIPB_004943 [Kipferlia bialata]|uniref:Protein kinase domain-containing protein n=1 Tax=Kipferlia bialata TaxID=797122 RepID=A0A9K3GIK1_9EUKA|nr:hypothetical protein KIPB_004943 [Kipferlia bialata]|eukprot:g4943.t1
MSVPRFTLLEDHRDERGAREHYRLGENRLDHLRDPSRKRRNSLLGMPQKDREREREDRRSSLLSPQGRRNSITSGIKALPRRNENGSRLPVLSLQRSFPVYPSSHYLPKKANTHDVLSSCNSMNHYTSLYVLGKGYSGKTLLVKCEANQWYYAMKRINRKRLKNSGSAFRINVEIALLNYISHNPLVTRLHHHFQAGNYVCLVMELASGGDLFSMIASHKRLHVDVVRFFTASLVCVIDFLHRNNIVFRDLKPENVLVDAYGYPRLCDFGLARILPAGEVATSTCGTESYMAPEVISGRSYGKEVDWWCLGIVIFEMLTGLSPFRTSDRQKMFKRIQKSPVRWSLAPLSVESLPMSKGGAAPETGDSQIDPLAKDLVERLLVKSTEDRLMDVDLIRQHPFFNGIDWQAVANRTSPPPYVPFTCAADSVPQQTPGGSQANPHNAQQLSPRSMDPSSISYKDPLQDPPISHPSGPVGTARSCVLTRQPPQAARRFSLGHFGKFVQPPPLLSRKAVPCGPMSHARLSQSRGPTDSSAGTASSAGRRPSLMWLPTISEAGGAGTGVKR